MMNTETTAQTETALLKALVLDPSRIDHVSPQLTGADFADPHLGHFFDVLVTAHTAGLPVGDLRVLKPELERHQVDQSVANAAALGRMFVQDGTAANALHYAGLVRRAAMLRHHEANAHEVLRRTREPDADPDSLAAWLEGRLATIGHQVDRQPRTAAEIADEYIAELKRPATRKRTVMSGLLALDETVGGWMPGELIVVAARTSMGKTALAMQMAQHSAAAGKSVLFASLEMRDTELIGRILCGAAQVDSRRIRSGRHNETDVANIEFQASRMEDHPLRVWSPGRATTSQIRAAAKRVRALAGLDLLIVDYIGLVRPSDPKRQRYEQIGQITGDLKACAQELEVPVIALCQVNRQADGTEPRLAHLRESGNVEQDADAVLFVHRAEPADTDATLIVAKHRHATTGSIRVNWIPAETRFVDPVPPPLDEFADYAP